MHKTYHYCHPLVISSHLVPFLSKFMGHLKSRTVSHRKYANLASWNHFVSKEPRETAGGGVGKEDATFQYLSH